MSGAEVREQMCCRAEPDLRGRADPLAPRMFGESYVQTRENGSGAAATRTCPSAIQVQTFLIE